jgi:hypothetical protein
MSAASNPARYGHSYNSGPLEPRHSLFLPMLIFLLGAAALEIYQVMSMEDQLDEMTQAIDKLDSKVKRAQYEKAKFFFIAKGVLKLAPTDTSANQVATFFKLRELQIAQPELFNVGGPPTPISTSSTPAPPTTFTNAAPETAHPSPGLPLGPDLAPVGQ